jgi:hypothetical protein
LILTFSTLDFPSLEELEIDFVVEDGGDANLLGWLRKLLEARA